MVRWIRPGVFHPWLLTTAPSGLTKRDRGRQSETRAPMRQSPNRNTSSTAFRAIQLRSNMLQRSSNMRTHRRDFLKTTMAASSLISLGAATVPTFLGRSARAVSEEGQAGASNDRVLVVVQLIGGNDGLNTVVPQGMDGYARHRRRLRLPAGQLHHINDEISLHPSLGALAGLLESGRLSVVQGVGYPNPDRSHFRSMEIWETARTDTERDALETGWLGRVLDAQAPAPGRDTPALQIGAGRLPLAFRSKRVEVPALENLDQFRLQLAGSADQKRAARTALDDLARVDRQSNDPLLGFIRRSTLAAYDSSRRLEEVAKASGGSGGPEYPNYGLARRLELIAQIIKAGFGTRIYYTSLGGFDTHANQLGTHAALLNELSDSLAAFHADLAKAGQADRVAVLSFSEFGRRVAENASNGTDHGAAAPVFVVGPVTQAGLVGEHPSLEDLDDGDLKHHTDFRSVYAALLQDWLGVPAAPIVGNGFEPLTLFSSARS